MSSEHEPSFRIIHVDDENPMMSKSVKRTLFRKSRTVEPGVFLGTLENQHEGEETEFRVAYGLITFLQILERLAETRAKVNLVMIDGELNFSGDNPIPCHGLDIIQIVGNLMGKDVDFPEYLRAERVEERFRAIPREVYEMIKFMIFSGAYLGGRWTSSSNESIDYMPRFQELDGKAPGLIRGLYGKPCDNNQVKSAVNQVLGIRG